ncbi:MAG: ABC transporter permease [Chloroflexia bacterium]|nr:ABC transporter permease [Chloroflexia bacterium]
MELLGESWAYVVENQERFGEALAVHLRLSLTALALAIAIFFPLGVLVSRGGTWANGILAGVAAARVIPSLAVLFLLLPVLGLGEAPALVALTLLAGPPLVLNTDAGLRAVDPAVLEAARGLGLGRFRLFRTVHLPLALPVVIAGVRSASIEVIGSATLAAFIGAGGLGQFITSGLSLLDERLLLVGAVPVTLLALFSEGVLGGLERRLTPPGATSEG